MDVGLMGCRTNGCRTNGMGRPVARPRLWMYVMNLLIKGDVMVALQFQMKFILPLTLLFYQQHFLSRSILSCICCKLSEL